MKSGCFQLFFTVLFLFSSSSMAQPSMGERPDNPEYMSTGKLVTIRVVPGDRTAKLYVVGKKAAELNVQKDHQILEITALSPQKKTEILQFQRNGDAYEISNMPSWKEPYDLNVKAETRGQKEEVRVRINQNKKP